ncbi:MAG TPA: ankyrin repeat domain-containing protein [Hydrogenophaga sp.]|uniref:ankyrin repeat domain-containing protein n=1 Tax=Hydrogenophaga sp. TaxID=1904254 RepID=UPI002BFA947B|nr:ankyrin repeat domain-containing protein [Hydrogenophaga sp.]HSX92812.1 ankyrin repeat domain-containing protein [Hydrogenophaga sp.]
MNKRIVLKCLLTLGVLSPGAWASSYDDFFSAIKRNDPDTLAQLAQRGFDLNTLDPGGQHPLYLALRDESDRVAMFLLSRPEVKVEHRNAKGESPLMMAALKGKLELVRRLIDRQAEVNKPGWAPLHYAATHPSERSLPVVRLLLEHHAFIDAQSPNGSTPLMMAALYGNPQVVRLLLEEGADTAMKNEQGLSAIDFAHRAGRKETADAIAAAIRAKQSTGRW